ncbi:MULTISPECIES: GlsB/YeaQ/YmgE family stress response membrane protein [unclassified Nostoc]|uniref:GlsB/YeaQ/YmgE family stress response membrane protein n=1 Tax=unclassified Nostoc TaxID=2593658 RepID=UPI002AD53B50|nr:GlsB/YeaQ/YmgE family stress response membrane protein [Nostoc sp. DedQUE03]MDZ7974125.1 GlsB/YeaQ/YmgE family stress response membrane protein [Nostoc sp. DedQUE03]MDZ8048128.1 GlsB/YeaQ/YmgE family stress response membrane protein [Nostoc sp. DedQUE02]
MSIIAWIVLGLLAGAIAKAIYPGYQGGGILSTMILGIIGAFVGGTLFTSLQTGTLQITSAGAGLTVPGILVAVIGAIVAIYLWGLIRRSSNV